MLEFGKNFADNFVKNSPGNPPVIELIGDVGAGKTTFTRGLAQSLGVKNEVTSPSFTISKSYALPNGKTLTHYDFYRLQDPGLMRDDIQEKIKDGHIVIVEWGKSIEDILPSNRIIIEIKLQDNSSREVIIKNSQDSTFRDISRPTGSELARSPVTTGATKRVEKSGIWLFLDTSSPKTILKLNDKEYQWESGHDLAEKLLEFIHNKLQENQSDWHDLAGITFMSGPGSFTGLRIGAAVVNTLAHELQIPLYDHHGEKRQIIIPEYGRAANISQPKK